MGEILRIENLHKRFGDLEVLKGIDVTVESGETIVVLGSSGSGKSTLLRCVNFMEMPTDGRVYLHGELIGTERGGAHGVSRARPLRAPDPNRNGVSAFQSLPAHDGPAQRHGGTGHGAEA